MGSRPLLNADSNAEPSAGRFRRLVGREVGCARQELDSIHWTDSVGQNREPWRRQSQRCPAGSLNW
jgi:hypothetical protein